MSVHEKNGGGADNYIGKHSRDEEYIGSRKGRTRSPKDVQANARNSGVSRYTQRNSGQQKRSSPGTRSQYNGLSENKRYTSYNTRLSSSNTGSPNRSPDGVPGARGHSGAPLPTKADRSARLSRSRKNKIKRFAKIAFTAAAVIMGLYYIIVTLLLSGVNVKKVDTGWQDQPASAVSGMSVKNSAVADMILLIGADDDGSAGSRADTLMYASINRITGKVRLCSVLRDSYVEIPGQKAGKINSAFAKGSDELCMKTMESNFRIRTKKFIRVNMNALIAAIDRLGGVELELSSAEAKAINRHFGYQAAVEGKQILYGKHAVYFARIRKIDDDFHRVSRQRILMSAIGKKCALSSPIKVSAAVGKAAPYVTTNLTPAQLSAVGARLVLALGTGNFEQMTVPVDGTWSYKQIGGQSCIKMDINTNAKLMRDFLLYES